MDDFVGTITPMECYEQNLSKVIIISYIIIVRFTEIYNTSWRFYTNFTYYTVFFKIWCVIVT